MSEQRPHIDDQDFKYEVVGTLAKLDTKMDNLVGAEGIKGRVPALEEDVKAINKKIYLFSGALLGIDGVIKLVWGIASKFVGKH